ncbi:MAG: GerMN domain-containing protein [Treponema sp.]|jgi:hypothetical protein|nr:GerMN domain-containing protein [Treponema sp.]
MNMTIKVIAPALAGGLARFFGSPFKRRILYLAVLGVFTLADCLTADTSRRTFVFYSLDTGAETVEERSLAKADFREEDIRRYTEEVLLGPVSPDQAPLFPRETRLQSLLYRNGTVYVDLSLEAAEGSWQSWYTLNASIRRNFPFVKDIRLFMAGREAYPEKFREKFNKK